MLLELLIFLYTTFMFPFYRLKDLWKHWFLCRMLTDSKTERIVVVIGNDRMTTDYKRCSIGKGRFFEGNFYSSDEETVVLLEDAEDF